VPEKQTNQFSWLILKNMGFGGSLNRNWLRMKRTSRQSETNYHEQT
jgi:hypothetical protein